MAAVEITISGVLYDKYNRTQQNVVLIGEAMLTGLSVGGGPVIPPSGQPPSIWPDPGHPAHPIAPGGRPPGIWGGPIDPYPDHGLPGTPGTWPDQRPPHPAHPIVNPPDEGTKPPDPVQPPITWKAVWHPTEGWVVVGIPNVPHPSPG